MFLFLRKSFVIATVLLSGLVAGNSIAFDITGITDSYTDIDIDSEDKAAYVEQGLTLLNKKGEIYEARMEKDDGRVMKRVNTGLNGRKVRSLNNRNSETPSISITPTFKIGNGEEAGSIMDSVDIDSLGSMFMQ